MQDYDYSFSQNGLVAYKAGVLVGEQVGGGGVIVLLYTVTIILLLYTLNV